MHRIKQFAFMKKTVLLRLAAIILAAVSTYAAYVSSSGNGVPSILADLKQGRATEVDCISGAVVRKAEAHGIEVPAQKMMAELVHAMEGRTGEN